MSPILPHSTLSSLLTRSCSLAAAVKSVRHHPHPAPFLTVSNRSVTSDGKVTTRCYQQEVPTRNNLPHSSPASSLHISARALSSSSPRQKVDRMADNDSNIAGNLAKSDTSSEGVDFLRRVLELVTSQRLLSSQRAVDVAIGDAALLRDEKKVVNFRHPKEFETGELINLSLDDAVAGLSEDELFKLCSTAVDCSIKTGHPYFRNQLYGGVDPYGLAAAWITEALNTNQGTFEIAPFFTMVEREVLRKIRKMLGWNPSTGDGIFSPGGSIGNMYGIVAARYKKFPECKKIGLRHLPPLAIFSSEDSHYSVSKSAHWLGLGTDSVIPVKTDDFGRILPSDLEHKVQQAKENGIVPICVVGTSGSTVLGSFDPLREIAAICKRHGIWFHVDACIGGPVLFSEKYRHLMDGVELVDSLVWNPHKMLGAPLQCSAFVINDPKLLLDCNSASATYLFQQDKFYDVAYDSGDKSVQCGRKTDGFKLWAMWKIRGDEGFKKFVENAFACTEYFYDRVKHRDGFKLVLPSSQCTHVCFWYVPKRLRGQEETEEWWSEIHKVAPEIKKRMTLKGSLMIGYQPLESKKLKNFFRLVITCHPQLTSAHMDEMIDEIDCLGANI